MAGKCHSVKLDFYRLKAKGHSLVQIEFIQTVYKNDSGGSGS